MLQKEFSQKIKVVIQEILASQYRDNSFKDLELTLEIPKQFEHGHLALPVFQMAKLLRKSPPLIAEEIAKCLNERLAGALDDALDDTLKCVEKFENLSGFVNITFKDHILQNILFESVKHPNYGCSGIGNGKRLVIDYSSPNVAKPMSIGHLRATVIGQALRNLAESQGYEVIGLNHLGDWGVQFGKLAWAYQQWGSEYEFAKAPIDTLLKLYVRFHDEAEKNPELDKFGSAVFKKLEQGDEEVKKIWQYFIEISLVEYQRLWDMLGVKHDLVRGESFYNDRLAGVVHELEEKKLLQESDGAQVVFLDDMPPCLIKKQDGASLYATRDIASAIYRFAELKADLNLYVVGVDQTLHFKQVFKVLEKMGYAWANKNHHITFGMYKFKDLGRMSTRKGNVIFLEDVLLRGIENVKKRMEEKNPDLPNKDKVAEQVGVGAVIFNDLLNDRVKNVDFDWDKVLSFDGDSGPYVQYTYVRCVSLRKKYGKPIDGPVDLVLDSPAERKLIFILLEFDHVLSTAFEQFKPNYLAQYLLEVCSGFSHFYHQQRILGDDPQLTNARMKLVHATEKVLDLGLKILSLARPEAM